jgi:hypothetical protein
MSERTALGREAESRSRIFVNRSTFRHRRVICRDLTEIS